jgi:hypothetical protein
MHETIDREIISARALRLALLIQRNTDTYAHPAEHAAAWRADYYRLHDEIEAAGTPAKTIEILVDAARLVQDAAGSPEADAIYPLDGIEVELSRECRDTWAGPYWTYERYRCHDGAWRLIERDDIGGRAMEPRLWIGNAGYEVVRKSLWHVGEAWHEARPLPMSDNLRHFTPR